MFDEEIMKMKPDLEALFKDLHSHPELGFCEKRTSELAAEYLEQCGLTVKRGIALTGVEAVLDSGRPGKTLLLRSDMDCLAIAEQTGCPCKSEHEGRMHACGHDAHITMLLGAASVLSRHKEALKGRIKFIFQPAEEGTPPHMLKTVREAGYQGSGGAGFMVQEGVLDGVDFCLAMHVQPSLPTGTVSVSRKNACASSDIFRITLKGKGGHGASPQTAVDPVPAASELISAIHMLPTREIGAIETCVISIGKIETPGSVWNAVADSVSMEGGFRTFNGEVREHLTLRIRELSENIARANRCELQYEHEACYMPCVNDTEIAASVVKSCQELLGEEHVIDTEVPAMSSEDFGAFLARVPGAFFWLGAGKEPNAPALHNPRFQLDPEALLTGVRVHVSNAVNLLNE